jgi:diaminopimelate decarboxylase
VSVRTLATFGGVAPARALTALRRLEPAARAFWLTDLDAFASRAERLGRAFAPLGDVRIAYAVKANGLPALLARAAAAGLSADCGSLGELVLADAAGFGASRRTLTGNGRTPEEAAWAARQGVAFVSADAVEELDVLQAAAAAAGTRLHVALRVNPSLAAATHRHIATGHDEAKFGVDAADAMAAFKARARWPHLELDGVHVHVGSQVLRSDALLDAARAALALADAATAAGARITRVDVGGGFGVDYSDTGAEFPLDAHAAALAALARDRALEWTFEPGRWLVAPTTVLVAEVLGVKLRRGRRFVTLAAGMNDLLRPALYGARHRLALPLPRAGPVEPATVVGPVCESADTFEEDVPLPPLERGDLVVLLDAGAYGASMSSNYNGRGRLAELVLEGGRLRRARAGETPRDLVLRRADDELELS